MKYLKAGLEVLSTAVCALRIYEMHGMGPRSFNPSIQEAEAGKSLLCLRSLDYTVSSKAKTVQWDLVSNKGWEGGNYIEDTLDPGTLIFTNL